MRRRAHGKLGAYDSNQGALPERKRATKKNFEWLLGSTMTAFSVFTLRDSLSRRYYRRISALSEVVDWSFDSGEFKDTRSIT